MRMGREEGRPSDERVGGAAQKSGLRSDGRGGGSFDTAAGEAEQPRSSAATASSVHLAAS